MSRARAERLRGEKNSRAGIAGDIVHFSPCLARQVGLTVSTPAAMAETWTLVSWFHAKPSGTLDIGRWEISSMRPFGLAFLPPLVLNGA